MSMLTASRPVELQSFSRALAFPEVTQEAVLRDIIVRNAASMFGRQVGFDRLRDGSGFRRCIPVSTYGDFARTIDRCVYHGEQGLLTVEPIRRFFVTSGSSAKPKYIPVTRSLLQAKARAIRVYWASILLQNPEAASDAWVTNFADAGCPVATPGGLPSSSESTYWSAASRAFSRGLVIPPEVARIGNSDLRDYVVARILLAEPFAAIMTLNPSTLLRLFETIATHIDALTADIERGGFAGGIGAGSAVLGSLGSRFGRNPGRAAELRAVAATGPVHAYRLWPSLRLAACWLSPMLRRYVERLQPHLGRCKLRDFVTMASEGVVSIPTDPGRRGGPLAISSHFYEFIPHGCAEDRAPATLLPHELEVGKRYVVVLTTQGGLYRYNLGDVVEVTGFMGRTPCIEFQHRAGATCSLTGEKLTEEQVTDAVADATSSLRVFVEAFTMAPAPDGLPRYIALMEFKDANPPASVLQGLPHRLDEALEQRNFEYGSKRGARRLGAPEVWVVGRGSYARFRLQRLASGTSESQFVPVHLTRDANFCEQFRVEERFRAR